MEASIQSKQSEKSLNAHYASAPKRKKGYWEGGVALAEILALGKGGGAFLFQKG